MLLDNTIPARISSFKRLHVLITFIQSQPKHTHKTKQNFLCSSSFHGQHLCSSSYVLISSLIENKIQQQNADWKWKILSSKLWSTMHLCILFCIEQMCFPKYHAANLPQSPPLNSYLFIDFTDFVIDTIIHQKCKFPPQSNCLRVFFFLFLLFSNLP